MFQPISCRPPRSRGLAAPSVWLPVLVALVVSTPAQATRGARNYPKVGQYVTGITALTPAQRDTLSWFDLLVTAARPSLVEELRTANPEVELHFNWMPQNLAKSTGTDTTWWYPDTTWSLIRLSQFYATKNDWFLRDTQGRKIPEWSGYAANWTRYCPRGVYGTSVGLTYVDWLVQVAIPQIVTSGRFWPKWGPGSGAYDGLMLEIMTDCVGSFGWQTYANADPDQDGVAEGVYSTCTEGGWQDSLSILYREMNDVFRDEIARIQDEGVLVLLNAENSYMGPSWRTEVSGIKLERWMSYMWNPWVDWWENFYGVLDWDNEEMIGPGYRWAEDFVGYHGDDALEGWDHSLVEVIPDPSWAASKAARLKRWGLGTCLLGEGFFIYTKDERGLFWQPEFDWDLGDPVTDYQKQTYDGGGSVDTLYWRPFTKGFVEVNPQNREVNGVPAEDSRFGFWQTVDDLAAMALAPDSARVALTMPAGTSSPVEAVELRYATQPVTAETWDAAVPYPGGPILAPPGSTVSLVISGLEAGETYYFATRNRVYQRLEPGTSNLAWADLPLGPQDLTPPSKIEDLEPAAAGTSWIRVTWSAPTDPEEGGVARYRIRYRLGSPIVTETDWNTATNAPGIYPTPGVPGAVETFTVAGLFPSTGYAVAVRSEDSAENLSPLSNSFTVMTAVAPPPPPPPPADTLPPAPIGDLSAAVVGESSVELHWTAPGDDGSVGAAASYLVRFLVDEEIATEADWENALAPAAVPPAPSAAGTAEAFLVTGLLSDRLYGLAVRAVDDAGNLAPLSAPLTCRTLAADDPPDPPDPPINHPPSAVGDLRVHLVDSTAVTLRWTAPHDGEGRRAARYRLVSLTGDSLRNEDDLSRGTVRFLTQTPQTPGTPEQATVDHLLPSTLYGFALFGVDSTRVAGEIGNFAHARTLDRPSPPPPPPSPDTTAPTVIDDLTASDVRPTALRLRWTAPVDDEGAVAYEIRHLLGRSIGNESDWAEAQPVAESAPPPSAPGVTDSLEVSGLLPESTYGFAVRARDAAGNLASLGAPLLVETPAPPDTVPPPSITDLRAEAHDPVRLRVEWAAVADDRDGPVVYRVGLRAGGEIRSESDWTAADTTSVKAADGIEAKDLVEAELTGLTPRATYGLAVRAVDGAGNRSPLAAAAVTLTMPDWPDTLPPRPIFDLAARERTLTSILLRWSAPADSITGARAVAYEVGWLPGTELRDEIDWSRATVTSELPPPSAPGIVDTFRVTGLMAETGYGLAVRSRDEAGLLSPLSAPLYAETLPDTLSEPPPDTTLIPPDTTAVPDRRPAPIRDLTYVERGSDFVVLRWTSVGEDSLSGTAAALEIRFRSGLAIEDEAGWAEATAAPDPPAPAPAGVVQTYRWEGLDAAPAGWVVARARDAAGQWSALAPGVWVPAWEPPPPEPTPPSAPLLDLMAVSTDAVELKLRHVATIAPQDSIVRYEARLDEAEITAERWNVLTVLEGAPEPGPGGTESAWQIDHLTADRLYFVAIRAVGAHGLTSTIASVTFRTAPEDLAPPDPPARPSLRWSEDGLEITLRWSASSDARITGYYVYGQSPGGQWIRLHETAGTDAELTLARPDPGSTARLAVAARLGDGTESALSDAVELWETEWEVEGPFPQPVTDGCRIRVRLPADLPATATLRVEVRSLSGERIAVLHDGPVAPGTIWEGAWDRRTTRGELASPGFHRLLCEGGGRRTVRTIYLAP